MSDESGVKWAVGTIKAKDSNGEDVAVSYDFGNTLEATTAKYGEGVVHYNACLRLATGMRNKLYSLLNAEPPIATEEAVAQMASWVPSVSTGRAKKSPVQAALEALGKMSDEEKAAFMADLGDSLED